MWKFLLFTLLYPISLYSQNYSVKTVFKGDTVVILSSEKVDEINQTFTNQKNRIEDLKIRLKSLNDSINNLNNEYSNKIKLIDSLNFLLECRQDSINDIKDRLNFTEKWLLESSLNSSYLYYSVQDSTIKRIDTGIFMLVGYRRTGNFSLVRMTDNKDSEHYIRKNWNEIQSPPLNWELNYKEKVRPMIYSYPFKINF